MVSSNHIFVALFSIALTTSALPLDSRPRLIPRQKNYSVINVDGGSTPPAQATIVVKETKTIEIVNPGPTVTQQVTATIVKPAPAPAQTSSTSTSTSSISSSAPAVTSSAVSSNSAPVPTPAPIFITVTVPKDDGPTEYYDNGMWHTNYRIKSFPTAVATTIISSVANATSTSSPA